MGFPISSPAGLPHHTLPHFNILRVSLDPVLSVYATTGRPSCPMAIEGYQPSEAPASICRMVFVALPDGMQLIVPHFNILRVPSPVVSRYATTGRPSCPMAMGGEQ